MSWGRSQWTRSAADSSVRRVKVLEQARVERRDERLRIVSDELWQRARARQAKQAHELGARVIGGLRRRRPGAGRPSKYVLSGLLGCRECQAGFVVSVNSDRYRCASHTNGGGAACDMSISVPRTRVERVILDFTERELPGILSAVEARYSQPHGAVDHRQRIAELERQIANFVKMIGAQGSFRSRSVPRSRRPRRSWLS